MARKMAGVGGMIFDVDQAFRFLVREQIPKFEAVCVRPVERVRERLESSVREMELGIGGDFTSAASQRGAVNSVSPHRQAVSFRRLPAARR